MNKVRELLLRYLQKMPFFPVRAMWAIYAYAAFMFSSLLIYISMILVLWNRTGLEPIEDMKEFCEVLFRVLLSGGDVAAITAEYQSVLSGLSDAAAVQLADKFPAWSDSTSYTAGARVQYSGELYKATADVQSATVPDGDPDHWSKL